MNILLPAKTWDTQICFQCKKYLSYGPVQAFSQGSITLIKCGRCRGQQELGTSSIYNIVAKHLIFPCVNRYEGCKELLFFNDVPEHEDGCSGGLYMCPLCPIGNYIPNSILYLINHYKIFHTQSILSKPVISLLTNSISENTFIYYDDSQNLFVTVYILLNNMVLNVNMSTVGDRIGKLKFRIKINVDSKLSFLSEFRSCSSFENNADVFSVVVPEYLSDHLLNILFEFDNSQIPNSLFIYCGHNLHETEGEDDILKNYGTTLGPKFQDVNLTKKFPSIYFNNELSWSKVKETNGISFLVTHFFLYTDFFCEFCENYCLSEHIKSNFFCKSCCKRICHLCQQSCENHELVCCSFCGINSPYYYKYNSPNIRPKIMYYCSYGCQRFFKGNELRLHEKNCDLNQKSGVSELELCESYFGKYFFESSENSKTILVFENTMSVSRERLQNKGKIYMITDTFHCLILYERQNNVYRFRVAHKYLPDKFFSFIRTVQDGIVKEDTNQFSLNVWSKAFVVILLKTNQMHKKKEQRKELKRTIINIGAKIGCLVSMFVFYIYFYDNLTSSLIKFKKLINRFFITSESNTNSLNSNQNQYGKNEQRNSKQILSRGNLSNMFFSVISLVLYCFKHMDCIPF